MQSAPTLCFQWVMSPPSGSGSKRSLPPSQGPTAAYLRVEHADFLPQELEQVLLALPKVAK